MINLDNNSNVPIYNQILEKFKDLILKGVLKEGDKLPSVRSLAKDLLTNPNTIQKAYKNLESEGYIEAKKGKGVYVKKVSTGDLVEFKNSKIKEFKKICKELIEIGFTENELIEEIKNRGE